MRLLLVDSSTEAIEYCATKIGDLDATVLSALQVDIRIAKEKDFIEKLSTTDLIIFGPDMEGRSALRAREVKALAPWLPILVFLSESSFRRGNFKPENEGDIRKVFPLNVSPGEVEHELLKLQDETGSATDHENPFSSKSKNRIVKLSPKLAEQVRNRLRPDVKSGEGFQHPFLIASCYEVISLLGVGMMGPLYLCKHKELAGHLVAVKVLFPEIACDESAAARFRNEIFAAYGASHPNVVRAYEYLRDGDLVVYTTEYVDGGSLAERLASREQIPISELVRILSEMCCGAQAIHNAGIVHSGFKPENILLDKNGTVKIADFGIARTGQGPKLAEHAGVVGTIDYLSPEYMLNSNVDWCSDIYAIGVIGYEMLTGEAPLKGDSVYETMAKRLNSDPEPPSTLRKDCPPQLDAIILRAINRDPKHRYQSASEMYNELKTLMDRKI